MVNSYVQLHRWSAEITKYLKVSHLKMSDSDIFMIRNISCLTTNVSSLSVTSDDCCMNLLGIKCLLEHFMSPYCCYLQCRAYCNSNERRAMQNTQLLRISLAQLVELLCWHRTPITDNRYPCMNLMNFSKS